MARAISDVFIGGEGLSEVLPLLIGAAVVAIIRTLLMAGQEMLAQRASSRLRQSLRRALLDQLFELGPTWLTGERTGEVVSAVTGGLESLDVWITSFLPARYLAALVPGLVLLLMLALDPPTALVLVLTGPVLVLLLAVIGSRARGITQQRFEEMRWMSAFFLEMLQGIATLKAFGRSREQAANIGTIGRHYGDTTMEVLRTAFQTALVLEWAAAVATAVVAVEVSLRLIAGEMAFETALAVLIVTPEFFLPLRQLAIRYHSGAVGRTASERLEAILDAPLARVAGAPTDHAASGPAPASSGRPVLGTAEARRLCAATITYDDVWFSYPGRSPVLRGLSMEIGAGSTVALVGASGAGKTTTADLLLRFMEPGSGFIRAGGSPVAQVDRSAWLAHVAWVPQRPHLTWGTVADAIRVASPEATTAEVIAAARAGHAHDFIRALPAGYDTPIGEGGQRLSGGQQQRLAIARAFLRDARLVVLDEPTSHLDAESEAAIAESLRRLAVGRTILLISHRLKLAGLADRVVVIQDGRAVRSGPPSILAEPGLRSALPALPEGA